MGGRPCQQMCPMFNLTVSSITWYSHQHDWTLFFIQILKLGKVWNIQNDVLIRWNNYIARETPEVLGKTSEETWKIEFIFYCDKPIHLRSPEIPRSLKLKEVHLFLPALYGLTFVFYRENLKYKNCFYFRLNGHKPRSGAIRLFIFLRQTHYIIMLIWQTGRVYPYYRVWWCLVWSILFICFSFSCCNLLSSLR